MDARHDKAGLRAEIRARRAARAPEESARLGALLAAHAGAIAGTTVAAFVGTRGEPSTLPLLDALRARGVRVLLPLLRDDMDLEWGEYAGEDALAERRLGLREPTGPSLGRAALADADIVLAPALAVDLHGRRLGQGGGSYDRALPRAHGRVVAVVHDDELLDAVPSELHDRRVDGALLPAGGVVSLPRLLHP